VVGDARQSIYRFRGAEVSAFRQLGDQIKAKGGQAVELQTTYRAHAGLLQILDTLLPAIMGSGHQPAFPYEIPYSPMDPARPSPRPEVTSPYVEVIVGLGERAPSARVPAARALVKRLLALRAAGEIQRWEEVALLFRASTGFAVYEDALEDFGVPFVTIAGRGFYERPEVRDMLNILRALAAPWDDQALVGLLRSPALGVSDAGLYQLRNANQNSGGLWVALQGNLAGLSPADQEAAGRARQAIEDLAPFVDRLPVAALLKRVIDYLNYRAVLASVSLRATRNLDKLLADAHTSGLVRVRAFMAYLRTLRDVGVREGEASVEAEGAVRLLTVHKAKGLEFPFVVLADAARAIRSPSEPAYLLPETGLTFKPDRQEAYSIVHSLAEWVDRQKAQAEENRLLYVAATRAQEKLIISGHGTASRGAWRTAGWFKQILDAAQLDLDELADSPSGWRRQKLSAVLEIGVWVVPEVAVEPDVGTDPAAPWPTSEEKPLYQPLAPVAVAEDEPEPDPAFEKRVTGQPDQPAPVVEGLMVHQALESWLFPQETDLTRFLEAVAINAGLIDPRRRQQAVERAIVLLECFRAAPLWAEITGAETRRHEVPYTVDLPGGHRDTGTIDLLYRVNGDWVLVDFKADELKDEGALAAAVQEYRPQLRRYAAACRQLLGVAAAARICFLDCMGEVRSVPIMDAD
jgi:ATP-dependent helicase/nuclease subunit A